MEDHDPFINLSVNSQFKVRQSTRHKVHLHAVRSDGSMNAWCKRIIKEAFERETEDKIEEPPTKSKEAINKSLNFKSAVRPE